MKAPFRADQVGSLLRPPELTQARRRAAAGELSAADLTEVENRAIEHVVARQEAIGLRAVTDGELRRDNWMFDFLSGLDGTRVVMRQVSAGSNAAPSPPMKAIDIAGRVGFSGHPMLEHFRFLQRHSKVTAKMTIPSPTMLVSASRNWRDVVDGSAYSRIENLYEDLASTYRSVIRAFYEAGCRYLQLDDVNMAYLCDASMREKLKARGDDPDVMLEHWVVMLNAALAHRPADMTITTHVCRGNFRSSWFAHGGYESIAEALLGRINYDGYFLEYDTERAGGFEPLRFLPRGPKKVVLGLVTSKSGVLENPDAIRERIDAASRFVDLQQLCLSPQCGFASTEHGNTLTEDEQWAKLARVMEVARQVWKDA